MKNWYLNNKQVLGLILVLVFILAGRLFFVSILVLILFFSNLKTNRPLTLQLA